MILRDRYDGTDVPFEGDRELVLRHLPADARVVRARATVTPVDASGGEDPFTETLRFGGGAEDWGATKVAAPGWVEVDFHARRTLAGVQGNFAGATLQVDFGGGFISINDRGTFQSPSDPDFSIKTNSAVLPGLTVSRFRLTRARPDVTAVRVRSAPSGVTLALRGQPAIWFHAGELARPQTTPDFGLLLQAFLDDAAEVADGVYLLPFVLHSDSIARLAVEVEIEYLRRASVLPGGVRDAVLPFDHGTLPRAGGLAVSLPADARVTAGAGRAAGAFRGDRIAFGPTGETVPLGALAVAPGSSPAHPVVLPAAVEAVAVDLLLASTTRAARLQLDLRQDLDGKPGGESFLPAPVPFAVDREMAGTPTWVSVPLPAPFQLRPGQERTYWLVLQSLEGEAAWSVETAPPALPPMQLTQDGGFSWREAALPGEPARLAGLFRLRYQPATFRMPIELQVGDGAAARRVDLSRFEPQGRVDLSLDLPEVAAAFNQVLDAAPGRCPEGEHLANGELERWLRVGDRLGEAHAIPLVAQTAQTARVAAGPEGRWAYVASGNADGALFEVVDLDLEETVQSLSLGNGTPLALAVSPDGARAWIGLSIPPAASGAAGPSGDEIRLFDLASRQPLGEVLRIPGQSGRRLRALALAPDGGRLYAALFVEPAPVPTAERVASAPGPEAHLLAFDTALLEEAALRGDADASAARLQEGSVTLTEPADLAVSPDGARLYLLAASPDGRRQILTAVAPRLRVQHDLSIPLEANLELRRLALAPDGARAVVAHGGGTLLVDLVDRRVLSSFADPGLDLASVAVEPDGSRAFLAGTEGLGALDLVRRAAVDEPVSGFKPLALDVAVTPAGDRIVVVDGQATFDDGNIGPGLDVISVGDALPDAWTLTAGRVRRFTLAGSLGRLAVLGTLPHEARDEEEEAGPHVISQVVPVAPCAYELSFQGLATAVDAVAEVIWHGEDCGLLRRDAIPIATVDPEAGGEPEYVLHRARLEAPAGATQAEVRFTAPAGVAGVNGVSLRATAAAVRNRDLRAGDPRRGGLPEGWSQVPQDAAGFMALPAGDAVRLRNLGLREAAVLQELAVQAGRAFTLEFEGRTVPAAARQASGRVELRWLAESGTEAAPPALFEVRPDGFDTLAASGVVPAGAVRAELRLAVPAGATLDVRRVDLDVSESFRVPVTFVAQAPGELSILDWELAYDQVPAPLPLMPAAGLCNPTPPPGAPGAEECEECGEGGAHHAQAAASPAHRHAVIVAPARVLHPHELLPARGVEPAVVAPITTVTGIGRGRARQLQAVGIRTLHHLADASPLVLRQAMRGISEAQAAGLILEAREALRRDG